MLAPLVPEPEDNVEAASGVDERLRGRSGTRTRIQKLAAQAEERDRLDPHHWNVKNIAEYPSRNELGVIRPRVLVETISGERW